MAEDASTGIRRYDRKPDMFQEELMGAAQPSQAAGEDRLEIDKIDLGQCAAAKSLEK